MYNYRYLQSYLSDRPSSFRSVLITGPRRSGKSTLALRLLEKWGGGSYVSFDTPLEQARFETDPEGLVRSLQTPAVLDEVQNVPALFNYIKKIIDEAPHRGCDYILTGSQQFQMMRHVSESLAGRIMIKELLPFSLGEAKQSPLSRVAHNFSRLLQQQTDFMLESAPITRTEILNLLTVGGFPQPVLAASPKERSEWFASYVETYVQRDVRSLSNLPNLSTFSRFLSLVVSRSAQIINYSEIGKDIGVNYKTARHYLSLLENSFLWRSLPPFFKSGSEKRLTKSPKGIFMDSGLAAYLAGAHLDGLERNPILGRLFETYVISEIIKLALAFGERITPLHFRAGESAEVDLVLEYGSRLVPIEIKCSASPDPSWGNGIRVLRQVAGLSENDQAYVISLAPSVMPLAPGILNVPLGVLA